MTRPAAALLVVVALSACGTGTPGTRDARPSTSATAAAPLATPSATPVVPSAPTTPAVPPTSGVPTARATSATPRASGATAVATCTGVPATRATQVVQVVATGSSARVRACERRDGRWVSVLGTMRGHVGRRGVAPPGAKREGDLRTPGGTFGLSRGFGQRPDPGVRFPWQVVGPRDVWVDDPASALYNTQQRLPADGRWDSAEPLDVPSYAYAQVVDHNTDRVPGRGSAIFLHVDRGRPTLGCVSLPVADLLRVLRWQRPGAVITIR